MLRADIGVFAEVVGCCALKFRTFCFICSNVLFGWGFVIGLLVSVGLLIGVCVATGVGVGVGVGVGCVA